MFGNNAREKQRQTFASQFEPNAGGFLYRRRLKDAPIQVSTEERDRYIESYNRFTRYSFWISVVAPFPIMGILLVYTLQTRDFSPLPIYAGIAVLLFVLLGMSYWAYGQPARELRGRGASGQAWTPQEVKRRTFARITYGQLAGAVAFALFMLFRVSLRNNLLEGWNRLWLVFAAGLIAIAAIQAFRKWRFELSDKIKP